MPRTLWTVSTIKLPTENNFILNLKLNFKLEKKSHQHTRWGVGNRNLIKNSKKVFRNMRIYVNLELKVHQPIVCWVSMEKRKADMNP